MSRITNFISTHRHLVVVVFYLFATFFYMGPSISDCSNTLYGFGDNTAGPIWRTSLLPEQPMLGGYEDSTNYPVGESLYSPTVYSFVGQTALIWGSSQVFGPICGYNVVNIVGFVFSALAMYFFIFWLTKNRWIAVLAGYAVSFSPYFQVKVGGHPGYGYQGLLVLALWSVIWLLQRPSRNRAVISGVTIATSFYFDPYLSLLVMTCVAPIMATWLILSLPKSKEHKKLFRNTIKYLSLALVTFAVCLLPLIAVYEKNKETITGSVSALRGNVLFEARACSNLPHEYTLPFVLHPVMKSVFGEQYIKMINTWHEGFSCGIGEDTVGLSLVMLLVVFLGMVIVAWEKINSRKLGFRLSYEPRKVIVGLSVMTIFAVLLALPPVKIKGMPTLSYVLLDITPTWRTLTRLYVVVNIGIVSLASIYMSYVAHKFKLYRRILAILYVVIFAVIVFEYQTSSPFSGSVLSTFSYKKDVPSIYTKIKDDPNINVLAEYPLERAGGESNATAYYLSMQVHHGKKLFNANDPLSREEKYRSALKDISDPQTISVLKTIGIDAVVIHGLSTEQVAAIPGLKILYSSPQSTYNMLSFTPTVTNDYTVVATFGGEVPLVADMITLGNGFVRNTNIIKSSSDWSYEALDGAELLVTELPGEVALDQKSNIEQKNRCFYITHTGTPGTVVTLTPTVDGSKQPGREISDSFTELVIPANSSIKLETNMGYNLRIKDLGCII